MTKQLSIDGRCCACGDEKKGMRNLIYLTVLALVPGKGWGCVACQLPRNGAIAVLCDPCFLGGQLVQWACSGWIVDPGRVPIVELEREQVHDLSKHPELTGKEPADG